MLSGTKSYVIEVVGGVNIQEHSVEFDIDGAHQLTLAKKLAAQSGRAAVLSGEVAYFWADIVDGELEVGAFDEDLLED